jgi:hypothetical protein
MARFRVIHRRPGRKDFRFVSAISLSLSLSPLFYMYVIDFVELELYTNNV